MYTQIQAEATKFSYDRCYMRTEHVHKYDYVDIWLHQHEYDYVDIWLHQHEYDYSSLGRTGSTSTLPCAASIHLSAAAALHRLRRTPPRHLFWACDYLDYLPRLVSTRKLVEDGSRDINN
jgi:hypothetical protein